jgi:type I restriction enzyme R subunit
MKHTERNFEDYIEDYLISTGEYEAGNKSAFNAKLGLFPAYIISFISSSQPEQWSYLATQLKSQAEEQLINDLCRAIDSNGLLHVIRRGFKCYGRLFRIAYNKPNSLKNPDDMKNYLKNELKVVRQVHFSIKNPKLSIDTVISLNGLPVATIELKNALTGQTVEDAKRQYKTDRDPNEAIFTFKKRALVNFAVDTDEIYMTTRLNKEKTYFLPFNKGYRNGAGNPPNGDNYKTAYLWEEVLRRDSLLEILFKFLHIEQIKDKKSGKVLDERILFPRYHQLEVVRKLLRAVVQQGAGHNYLIQHSAGSGKSNSIAWLAHRLSGLHNKNDEKIFNSVIIITDRIVLDRQLQDTVYQFDHVLGTVEKIKEGTQQLVKALAGDTPIIITTLQKFPFITSALDSLEKKVEQVSISTAGKRYAVIVDEAHSSQTRDSALEIRKTLNKDGIEAMISSVFMPDDNLSAEAKQGIARELLKRKKQDNLSFFAFTATPKFSTMAIFDEPSETGEPPFHLYSMKQAVEEGFILNVLEHYTTYEMYYEIINKNAEDPSVIKRKANKALMRFVKMHPANIQQKVEIIVEHFRTHTLHKLGGRAKAMLVTDSRESAVRYKLSMDSYIKGKGYTDIKALVAFSGDLALREDLDKIYTEVSMNNGIKEKELPEAFEAEYQVLIVAEKYQTGFDQPLLHTMFVDKVLGGVQAVQTLSRLNRTSSGKDDTFILDFVNKAEDIYEAFKPYYEDAIMGAMPDYNKLDELKNKILDSKIIDESDVDKFTEVWSKTDKLQLTKSDHRILVTAIEPAVMRYNAIESDETKEQLKSDIASFLSLYSFMSQILPYDDYELEKYYPYMKMLSKKIAGRVSENYDFSDDLVLKYYRLQKISENTINLEDGEAKPLKGPLDVGTAKPKDEAPLSELINRLNERFGTDFTPADQLFFEQIQEESENNPSVQNVANANSFTDFELYFRKICEEIVLNRHFNNEEIVSKFINNSDFNQLTVSMLAKIVYHNIKGKV